MMRYLVSFRVFVMIAILCGSSAFSRAFAQKRYLIAVGIDRYKSLDVEYNLHGAGRDVENMVAVLGKRFKFGGSVLLNHDATYDNINKARLEVERQAESGDQVVFYFSGRGCTTKAGQPTVCPYDAKVEDSSRDIGVEALCRWVNSLEEKKAHVVVILDCGFAPPPPAGKGIPMRPKFYERLDTQPLQVDAIEKMNVDGVLVTACTGDELAREFYTRRGHWEGIFTHFLADALGAYEFGQPLTWRQLIGDTASMGMFSARAGGVAPTVMHQVSINYPDDTETQTPSTYGKGVNQVVFSPDRTPPQLPSPEDPIVRVRVQVFHDGSAAGQQRADLEEDIKEAVDRLEYVRVVESDEAADRTIMVLRTKEQTQVYLTNSHRAIISDLPVVSRESLGEWLNTVNLEVRNLYWYRWVATLKDATLKDTDTHLRLTFRSVDGEKNSRVAFKAGDRPFLHFKPEGSDVFLTLLLMDTNGEVAKVFPGPSDDNRVSADKDFILQSQMPLPPGRYTVVAVAAERDTPYQQILEEFRRRRMTAPRHLAMATESKGKGKGKGAGDASDASSLYAPPLAKLFGERAASAGGKGEPGFTPEEVSRDPLKVAVALTTFSVKE